MTLLTAETQILAPKVVNGVFASLTDIALYSLTERLIGSLYTSTAVRASSRAMSL
jgi:hypothetical protein